MKALLFGIFTLSSVIGATSPAAAHSVATARTVQLIRMGAPASDPGSAPNSENAGGAGEGVPEGQPRDQVPFAVHDLQRRWIEFQMANSFAGAGLPSVSDGARPALAEQGDVQDPLADLSIPAWMRGAIYSDAPVHNSGGCFAAPYHPTGFLTASAEVRRSAYYAMMSHAACEYGIPVGLFDAMIIQESRYNAGAVSPKNAYGLTQLMPDTAAGLGVNRFDVAQNLRGGARYLRQQLDRFGQVHLALAAYNAGPGNVKNGLVPRFAETRAYVSEVLASWSKLAIGPRTVTVLPAADSGSDAVVARKAERRRRIVSVSTF